MQNIDRTHIANIKVILLLTAGRPFHVELVEGQFQLAFRCLKSVEFEYFEFGVW